VRVPHFALFPQLQAAELDVAVCVSQPRAKDAFDGAQAGLLIAETLFEASGNAANIHIFGNAETYAALKAQDVDGAADGRVHLYDPAEGPPVQVAPASTAIQDSTSMAWNPWLHWMAHVLRGRSLEIVHFVAHTYLAQAQSALAVSEAPTVNEDRSFSRFIGPQQLTSFLDHVGAWAVGVSTPDPNFSPMGARLLVDELAHRRAGPVVLHELATDRDAAGLRDTYRALFDSSWPERHTDVALYCHPRLFLDTSTGDSLPYAEVLLAEPRGSAVVDQPAWVTVTQRYLEQSTARLFPDTEQPTSEAQLAAGEGVRQALSFVNNVMASYSGSPVMTEASAAESSSAVEGDTRPRSQA
jgi:hypothetical protein